MKLSMITILLGSLMAMPAFGQVFTVGVEGEAGDVNNWPGGEAPAKAVDGLGDKYLNFGKEYTGIAVTPSGGAAVATGLTVYNANDSTERNAASYSVYGLSGPLAIGTTGDISGLTLVSSGGLSLPATFQDGGGAALDPANSQTVDFANATAYDSYIVVFPTLADGGAANSMQTAEIQLLDDAGANLFNPNSVVLGGQLTVVPEPATAVMALLSLLSLGFLRRR